MTHLLAAFFVTNSISEVLKRFHYDYMLLTSMRIKKNVCMEGRILIRRLFSQGFLGNPGTEGQKANR